MALTCPLCRETLSVGEILDAGTVSDPAALLFQFLCPRCRAHAVARAGEGRLETGTIQDAGFSAVSWALDAGLSVHPGERWLDSWYAGQHRRFPAK
jgi:hypothetical protein